VFQEHPEIDVLLTDIVMPGELQGTTLAKALRELEPKTPVVFMSGYASEATVHGNGLRLHDTRLMKPVRRDDLLRAVRKALSQIDENEK
jgi:two-component SAPR family response regulator